MSGTFARMLERGRRTRTGGAVLAALLLAGGLIDLPSSQATGNPQNITGNQTIGPGQALESTNDEFALGIASNDNLQEHFNGGGNAVVWTSSGGVAGDHALLQPSGNLLMLDSTGKTLWSSKSSGTGCPSLDLQRDGSLVIYDPTLPAFQTPEIHSLPDGQKLLPGWVLYAPDGLYYLAMQTDGNLVIYSDTKKALWSSGTAGNSGAWAWMQTDGNFVIYSAANKAIWQTETYPNPGAAIDMQGDGNLVVYSKAGKALWNSGTNGGVNNGSNLDPKGPAGSATPCPAPASPTPATTPTKPTTPTKTQSTPPPSTETTPPATTEATPAPTTETAPPETAPPAAATAPVGTQEVPIPKPRPHHHGAKQVRVKVRVKWHWHGARTWMEKITVGSIPPGAHVRARLVPQGSRHHALARAAAHKHGLRALVKWLKGAHYRVGERLVIDVTRPGYAPERATFRIRDNREPKLTSPGGRGGRPRPARRPRRGLPRPAGPASRSGAGPRS